MITDLLRNDLTQINLSPASVRVKKHPLFVPGLVHQFSIIESELAGDETLKSIILALFPGGSITGAPKKNVVRLINEIEQQGRGFYCGSTVLLYQNIQAASINIRSIEVDFKENKVLYGSGGGVTLESNAQEEFEEMQEKLKSFLCLF